tara:strand:+ start:119 stop:334 length:216 start_codon:yes stop_codon:yes gene_type:complete
MKTTKGVNMKITKELVDKTKELMTKHLTTDGKGYSDPSLVNDSSAKEMIRIFLKAQEKVKKDREEKNNENI